MMNIKLIICLITVFVISTSYTQASPQIDIEFETDKSTGKEWIHAKANYQVDESQAYNAFNAVVDYPELHRWIQNAKIENNINNNKQEFLVEFDFPWPIGKQWSRIEIETSNSVISWKQTQGSLNRNQGRITIAENAGQAYVEYHANLDVGYPDALTRAYKEQFVTEFLTAIYNRLNEENKMVASATENSVEYITDISP